MVNSRQIVATGEPCDGRECSIEMQLAPLGTAVFRIKKEEPKPEKKVKEEKAPKAEKKVKKEMPKPEKKVKEELPKTEKKAEVAPVEEKKTTKKVTKKTTQKTKEA